MIKIYLERSGTRQKRQALQTVRLGYAARSYLKRDLEPRRKYRFTIMAIATAGRGPPADVAVDTKYDKYVPPDGVEAWIEQAGHIKV